MYKTLVGDDNRESDLFRRSQSQGSLAIYKHLGMLAKRIIPCLDVTGGCGITIDSTGRSNTGNNDRQIIIDATLNWDPSDKLSTWMNFDYMAPTNDRRSGKPYLIGIAAAGRYGITDSTGISLRGEYLYSNDNYIGVIMPLNLATIGTGVDTPGTLTGSPAWYREDQDIWSLTATLDHSWTEHLTSKFEVVYQQGHTNHRSNGGATNNEFFCNKSCNAQSLTRNQVLLGAQMTYEF